MNILKYLLSFIASGFFFAQSFSGTYTNNIGVGFPVNDVGVFIASNTDCSEVGMTVDELAELIPIALDDYWNNIPTSALRLSYKGLLETDDDSFNTGVLCNVDLDEPEGCSSEADIIPDVTEIVITCNSEETYNFTSTSIYALTLTTDFTVSAINGSLIAINAVEGSKFGDLNRNEKIVVLAHEVGHAIGIGHTPNAANIMYFTLTPSRFALGQDDRDAATFLYPHDFDGCGALTVQDISSSGGGAGPGSKLWSYVLGLVLALVVLKSRKQILRHTA